MMMTYSTFASMTKPTDDALQIALTILANNGFAIISRDKCNARLSGPGLNSTRQNPLLGATEIFIAIDGDQLKVDAELGGPLQGFISRLPLFTGLGVGLLLCIQGVCFGQGFGVGFGVPGASGWTWALITFGSAGCFSLMWLAISRAMSYMIQGSTEVALTNLVNNAVQLANAA